MSQPDRELIAQVMLFSQGFRHAEGLASKIVPFFEMCREQLSAQSHYDFGLRALKSVLLRAGILIREHLGSISTPASSETSEQREVTELELMVRSLQETLVPKLLGSDVSLIRR
jgi:dynein heavy chain 1